MNSFSRREKARMRGHKSGRAVFYLIPSPRPSPCGGGNRGLPPTTRHVSRWRHRRRRESYPGDAFPQLGQHDFTPCSCATCTVTSPFDTSSSTSATCHGLLMPGIWAYRPLSLIHHTVIYPLYLGKSHLAEFRYQPDNTREQKKISQYAEKTK